MPCSFSYELDEPKPVPSNVLKTATNKQITTSPKAPPSKASTSPRGGVSASTRSVIGKQLPAANKFQNRLNATSLGVRTPSPYTGRATSAVGHYRYEAPTSSTLAKARGSTSRPTSPAPPMRGPAPPRRRAGSSSAVPQTVTSTSSPASGLGAAARRRAGSGPTTPPSSPEKRASARREPSQDFSEFARYVIAMPPGSHGSNSSRRE